MTRLHSAGTWLQHRAALICAQALVLSVTVGAVSCGAAYAQETPPPATTPTPTPAPSPIPATEIPLRAEQTTVKLRELTTSAKPRDAVQSVHDALVDERAKLGRMAAITDQMLEHGPSVPELTDLAKRWLREDALLDSWLSTLQTRATKLESDLGKIRDIEALWRLTRDSADEQDLPPALRSTVNSTIEAAADARAQVSRRRDSVLTLQTSTITAGGEG